MTRMRGILGAAFLTLVAACAAASAPPPAPRDARPTLEEIFGDPPIDGVRPSDLSISADGRYVAFRWWAREERSDDVDDAPQSRPAARRAPLHVVSTRGGEATPIGDATSALWRTTGAELVVTRESTVSVWSA
ncbi:MAG TPA: hypothetical protein VKE69_00490, partial [Planctomycetota bacterium]|nr:hypothetical protein [Planctomycetota bacterium]